MKRRDFLLSSFAMATARRLSAQKPPYGDDVVLKAMLDELDRVRQLRILGNADDAPYFVEYSVSDSESFNCSASLGALMSSSSNRFRSPHLQVRVGSYALNLF